MDNQHFKTRRLIGIGGIVLALLLLPGIMIYATGIVWGQDIASTGQQLFSVIQHRSTPTPTPPLCTAPIRSAGKNTITLTSGGLQRTFLLHLPPSYGKYQQPLVIGYHGYSWTARTMEHNTGLDAEADKEGFILASPQGLDSPSTWNAGAGAYGPTGDANDIQFTQDILTYLKKNYCVNPARIYLTGFSLGGGMVYRLACTLSTEITAIATVSGAYYPFGACKPARPLPILEIHGGADDQAPYAGNPSRLMIGVDAYLKVWLTQDRCTQKAGHVFLKRGDVTGTEWTQCARGVEVAHYRANDGGHSWSPSKSLNTNEAVWQFLSRFSHQ
jgi:polyhydroxybutyrate depolymerase